MTLEAREYAYGWIVTLRGPDGRLRHVATATSAMAARRLLRRIAAIYQLHGRAQLFGLAGDEQIDLTTGATLGNG